MADTLVLENTVGQVSRIFPWMAGESAFLVRRHDKGRFEVVADLSVLDDQNITYDVIENLQRSHLSANPTHIAGVGYLKLVPAISSTIHNEPDPRDRKKVFYTTASVTGVLFVIFMAVLVGRPIEMEGLEEELKEHVVKVVKKRPPRQVQIQNMSMISKQQRETETKPQPTKKAQKSVRRMGALAVLGSSKNSKQRGGLDLGAVNTTAGPGLGGTGGSGGTQTSLYAKGIVAAPVGAGGNIKGGGGYGTKGKGGGKAGYGKLSLIGSAGTNPIPLGKEAIVDGGLDRDLIAAVIQRYAGQIRFCYEQGLQQDPALRGRVAIDFVIGGNGRVKTASVGNTSLHSKIVEDCILFRLRSWKFPLPEGGVDVSISFPFLLQRNGQG